MAGCSLVAAWRQLPPAVTHCLLHHSALPEGRLQAGLALLNPPQGSQTSPQHRALATDLILGAWECDPLNTALMGQLLPLHQQIPFLSPPLEALFRAVVQHGLPDSYPTAESGHTGQPAPIDHMGHAHDPRLPLALWCQALACVDSHKYAAALTHLDASLYAEKPLYWQGYSELRAHCLWHTGQHQSALQLWRLLLQQRPWHVQLALRLHDCMLGHDQPCDAPAGPTAVLVYSWNKAADLHNSLLALEASHDDIALLVCLNNGSTDSTAECLNTWADRWGQGLHNIHLPVNIGAAAARNWLAALPEVQNLPFAAYIDDDVSLPADWLRHLARAVEIQPRAGVWGCRIQDAPDRLYRPDRTCRPDQPDQPDQHHGPLPAESPYASGPLTPQGRSVQPPTIQSGPLHLTLGFAPPPGIPPLPGQAHGPEAESAELAFSPLRAHAEPFSVTTMPPLCADRGQWDYIRPCASVTGCCHLFRSASLQGNGFSLNLSPSQYDDLEHDLRALRDGTLACYTGFCAGQHAQRSGQQAGGLSAAAFGSGLGNKYKLHGMFSEEDVYRMAQLETTTLETDLLQKLAVIDAHM